ncbi:MAG: hypothetical protein HRU41_18200 [Saprospiraceae bacterium]|nr:hypothetical protein [Saprospiraceae bacterium]
MKNAFNILILCLLVTSACFGQDEQQKTISKVFSGKQKVSVTHRYGPLQVVKSGDGQIKLTATLSARTKEPGDMELLEKQFDLEIVESTNILDIKTNFEIENWNSRNGIISLKFKDGSRLKQVKDLEIGFLLEVPNLEELSLANKYDEIIIREDISTNLNINLYDGRLQTANIDGQLKIATKYSKGSIGNFTNGELNFYDSDFNLGNAQNVLLTSKYSKLQFSDVGAFTIESYDDKITWTNVKGDISIIDKYSDFVGGSFANGKFELHDSKVTLKDGESLQLKSKYTKFKFGTLQSLSFELSYDDKVEIVSLGSLKSKSKYTDYNIGELKSGLSVNSYDDDFEIERFTGPLQGIDFTGKYSDITLILPESIDYRLEAYAKYGKIQYAESSLQTNYYKEKNDEVEIKGQTKNASDSSPLISINSYDGKIILN